MPSNGHWIAHNELGCPHCKIIQTKVHRHKVHNCVVDILDRFAEGAIAVLVEHVSSQISYIWADGSGILSDKSLRSEAEPKAIESDFLDSGDRNKIVVGLLDHDIVCRESRLFEPFAGNDID